MPRGVSVVLSKTHKGSGAHEGAGCSFENVIADVPMDVMVGVEMEAEVDTEL